MYRSKRSPRKSRYIGYNEQFSSSEVQPVLPLPSEVQPISESKIQPISQSKVQPISSSKVQPISESKVTHIFPPPNVKPIPPQPNIDITVLLTTPKPPDPSIIAHSRVSLDETKSSFDGIGTPLANELMQNRDSKLLQKIELIQKVRDELKSRSIEELQTAFQEWGFSTDGLRNKDDYIDKFFEFVASLLPPGSPQSEINLLVPPLSPRYP